FGPGYIVKDSGVRVGRDNIYWLDNRRVIFIGTHDPKPVSWEEGRTHPATIQILIWDTDTNKVHAYRKSVPKPNLCYANGRIRYRLKRVVHQHKGEKIRVVYYMAGPLEKPVR